MQLGNPLNLACRKRRLVDEETVPLSAQTSVYDCGSFRLKTIPDVDWSPSLFLAGLKYCNPKPSRCHVEALSTIIELAIHTYSWITCMYGKEVA